MRADLGFEGRHRSKEKARRDPIAAGFLVPGPLNGAADYSAAAGAAFALSALETLFLSVRSAMRADLPRRSRR